VNKTHVEWDYKFGDKLLVKKDDILHKSESLNGSDPLTVTSAQLI
jgi:hypothetical protein